MCGNYYYSVVSLYQPSLQRAMGRSAFFGKWRMAGKPKFKYDSLRAPTLSHPPQVLSSVLLMSHCDHLSSYVIFPCYFMRFYQDLSMI